jgi:hypothetical protein
MLEHPQETGIYDYLWTKVTDSLDLHTLQELHYQVGGRVGFMFLYIRVMASHVNVKASLANGVGIRAQRGTAQYTTWNSQLNANSLVKLPYAKSIYLS